MCFKNTLAGLSLFVVCSSACAQISGDKEWTEQEVLLLFEQQTPIKREIRSAVSASVQALRSRTLWPNPIAAYSRETVGFTEFFQGEQQLPISGRLSLARKALDPAREAAEADGAARIWDLRSNLRMAFYRGLASQRQEELIEASLKEVQQVINLLVVREREGEGSRYDRLRAERETSDLRADIAVARARARNEKTVLLSYLPPETMVASFAGDVGTRPFMATASELVTQALRYRADFRAQSSRLAQLSLEQQAADRLRRPEPMVTAGMKRTQVATGQNAIGAVVGVSISLPVFSKGQTEVARLSAEQDRIRAQQEQLTVQVRATVNGAYEVFAARVAALTNFERETSGTDTDLLRIAKVGYEEGELGILQLLDAYRLKRQTALRKLELQLAVRESEIELSRAAGVEVTQ